ncbi:MAG: type IX secretion system ring subunit PorN/GldN [Luteibaculaceae bacterium]
MGFKRFLPLLGLLFLAPLEGNTQVLDGAYIKERTPLKKVIPLPYIREADVMYHRRVWRDIVLSEKQNHPIFFPVQETADRASLFDVIKKYALESEAWNIYSPEIDGKIDDQFRKPLTTRAEREKAFSDEYDDVGEDGSIQTFTDIWTSDKIVRFRIKEDWIFDKQRSEFKPRIIGIAPMAEDRNTKDAVILFWLYFPEWRHVFVNHEVFNRQNDAERRTIDEFFLKRQFSSYIVKESNVFDRNINEYFRGLDALLESERIKADLFNFEHDLWDF